MPKIQEKISLKTIVDSYTSFHIYRCLKKYGTDKQYIPTKTIHRIALAAFTYYQNERVGGLIYRKRRTAECHGPSAIQTD